MNERELTERFRQGDTTAYQALIARYEGDAVRLATLLVQQRAVAEDAVQDALLLAWRHRGQLRSGSTFWPWFYTILLNTVRKVYRGRERRPEISLDAMAALGEPASMTSEAPGPEEIASDREIRRAVSQCVAEIENFDQRVVLVMRYYEGLADSEIAARLGCPVETVRSRLHRAKAGLRARLRRDFAWVEREWPTALNWLEP